MISVHSHSIRFRLTASYAAGLALTFGVLGAGAWVALKRSTEKTVDENLRSRLNSVRLYIDQQSSSEDVSHLVEELSEEGVMSSAAVDLRVADPAGHWIYRSPGTESWKLGLPAQRDLPAKGRTETITTGGKRLRVISAAVKIGTAQIATPLDEFDELQDDFLWTIAVGAPLLLLLASAGGYWMSGRALKPVDDISRAARRISAQNLSERLPASGNGDELDRLSQVLNEMLGGLESSFRRVAQFTMDASHELRTPVAIIRTTAEVIQSRPRTVEEHSKAWQVVTAQAERSSELVADLLVLARADGGSEVPVLELIDLGKTVCDACGEMQVLADRKGLGLAVSVIAECCIKGDRDAIRQAVWVLLDNAIKFTVAGRIDVSVRSCGRYAVIEVKDTGIGIAPHDIPHLFDRFYRAAKDRSRRTGGAGLGLAIAKGIAVRHGGDVSVESQEEVGSVFRLQLPM